MSEKESGFAGDLLPEKRRATADKPEDFTKEIVPDAQPKAPGKQAKRVPATEKAAEESALMETLAAESAETAKEDGSIAGAAAKKDSAEGGSGEKDSLSAKDFSLSSEKSRKERFLAALKKLPGRWFITAFSGMAIGLFCTLIAGTILEQIAKLFGTGKVATFLTTLATVAKFMMGAGIGAGIAHSLKAPKMVIASCIVAGFFGAFPQNTINGTIKDIAIGNPGNPVSCYLAALVACECGLAVSGKTGLDILVVPLVCFLTGGAIILALGVPVVKLMDLIGKGVALATQSQPFLMGIVVSVAMGLLLTLPTSSAAIGISIGLSGISAGAAVAGCCCHMVGFAVASFRENKWGGLVSQGLGTSMLQIPNLGKNPRILLPAVIASAICGPVSSCLFKLQATKVGSGMGTAGLVGVIDAIAASSAVMPGWQVALGVAVTYFLLPAAISLLVSEWMRKKGWIRFGDMKISTD